MRKTVLLVLALALTLASQALPAESSDVIVLLDTSESVFGFFESIVDYVVKHVANDYLLKGDTFHLLTFSETSQLELSKDVTDEDSIRSIVSRLYLLLPFGKKTDILSGLSYLDQYVSDLGETKAKRILIITDGVHNPPSGSPYAGLSDDKVLSSIDEMAASMVSRGWKVSLIRVPFTPEPGSRATASEIKRADDFIERLSTALRSPTVTFDPQDTERIARETLSLPEATYPGPLGTRSDSFSFPVKIRNSSNAKLHLELRSLLSGDRDILGKASFINLDPGASGTMQVRVKLPIDFKNGPLEIPVKLIFADGMRVNPSGTVLALTLSRNPISAFFQRFMTVILFALIVLALLAVIAVIAWTVFGMTVKSQASVSKAAQAQAETPHGSHPAPSRSTSSLPSSASTAAVSHASSASGNEATGSPLVKHDALLDLSGKKVLTDGYVIPVKMKEKIVPTKEPSKAKVEAERKRAERIAEAEARKRESRFIASLRTVGDGNALIHMTIIEQNPAIGLRNVHHMKAGTRLQVGGGKFSDFLVFVVQVPKRIAEVYWNGKTLTFLPIRADYFPGMDGPVEDCIGKKIHAVSPQGFSMTIIFDVWVNPQEQSNKLLRVL